VPQARAWHLFFKPSSNIEEVSKDASPNLCSFERLEETLKAAADAALKAHRLAQDDFYRVCSTQSRGKPKEVQDARDTEDITRQALAVALIRLNDFMYYGVIPEDLSGETRARSVGAS
jgi:hypothetical protein